MSRMFCMTWDMAIGLFISPLVRNLPLRKMTFPFTFPSLRKEFSSFAENKGIQYDLIHSHYWMSGWLPVRCEAAWNVPVVQMFHTLGLMKNRLPAANAEMETPPSELRAKNKSSAFADRIVIATPAEKDQLIKFTERMKKIDVIPPGVDTSRFYPIPEDEARSVIGVPTGNCMILFVGRIEPFKGIETLLRAIALLLQDRRDQ